MSDQIGRAPELLAPAGGIEALRAAVANGADAVYLGAQRFNARGGAQNFTLETLEDACRFAHLRGVLVYLTVNVLVLPDEMSDALDLVDRAWVAGVDAVIIQDLGLMRCVRQVLPHVRVHASTQLNVHSSSSLRALAFRGVARVTLARETTLSEIARLAATGRGTGVGVESFVHGALCVCYSGQCLLSSLIGARSANRGACAQPCRLPYELVDGGGAVCAASGAYLLSPKDLAGIAVLPGLVDAGVSSLKIEGRVKSPEYVAITTGVYRAALDRALSSPETYEVRHGELSALAEAFNRGFTEAYLIGERGDAMMSTTRPNNRGVPVGRIGSIDGSTATVVLQAALDSADTIEVWTSRGRFAQVVGRIDVDGHRQETAPAGSRVRLRLEGSALAGDRVFRVRNEALMRAAERTYAVANEPVIEVDVEVRAVIGQPLTITVTHPSGVRAEAAGGVVEPARTRVITAHDVVEHVGRFGGSGFAPRSWDVAISPGAGAGFSELHRVRRTALEALEIKLLAAWTGRQAHAPSPPLLPEVHRRVERVELVAVVSDAETARVVLEAGADRAHVPIERLDAEGCELVSGVLPRICHDDEEPAFLARVRPGTRVVAGTLGLLTAAVERGAIVEAHWSLNVTNAYSTADLAEAGASFVWLSPELSARQVASVARGSTVSTGIAVTGRQEVMVTEHCVLTAEGECAHVCSTCARRGAIRALRDRKGYRFPVRTDEAGRTHVYNSVPLDLTHVLDQVVATGIAAVRLDLETESQSRAIAETARVRAALDDLARGTRPVGGDDSSGVTSGHFFRGV